MSPVIDGIVVPPLTMPLLPPETGPGPAPPAELELGFAMVTRVVGVSAFVDMYEE